jgi:K+-transporting ATPase ATPase C chain
MTTIFEPLRPTIVFLALSTGIFGFAYPAISTIAIQGLFPKQAGGSLIEKDGKVLGSELIGQQFTEPKYFWSRLSATSPYAYNPSASSGSNLGAANPALLEAVNGRLSALGNSNKDVPVDLVTASGSGLDPHITPAAAEYQIKRVATARNVSEEQLRTLVAKYTEGRQLGFLGEKTVNVLKLNLALDGKM